MKIRDIVNRDLVNLENCESEPIHIPGSIQPHGFLIALNQLTLQIDFRSGNVEQFTGTRHDQLLGKHCSVIIPCELSDISTDVPFPVLINNKPFTCISHQSGDQIVIEFEPETQEPVSSESLFDQTLRFIRDIEISTSLKSLCQSVADEMRKITGYDRVMIYRFDEEYNGEVYAESCRDDIEPFLGLHYPHTDIPVQARELYLRNLLRLIVDINYQPVPVFTIDDGKRMNLDMSHAGLRSVSPIHVQYLQNMGVGATLTISLVQGKKLWGLIACHHYAPKNLSQTVKLSAKLQGHFLSSQIKVREANDEYEIVKTIEKDLQKLLEGDQFVGHQSLTQLVGQKELLDICHASGVALMVSGELYTGGSVPEREDILRLLKWLSSQYPSGSFHTEKLSSVYDGGSAMEESAAGILFHSLARQGNSIIWFRQETQKEMHWGGDPQKAILKDEKGLHPRKSFALWKEVVRGKSKPWLKPELDATTTFTHYLQRQLHLLFVMQEEARYRELSLQLKQANVELEKLNWIGSHDLKEPLRKIQVFASRILDLSNQLPERVTHDVGRMKAAAERMQQLIYDLISYSQISRTEDTSRPVDLNLVIASVLNELTEEIERQHAKIAVATLPSINGVTFLLNQLFLNLIRNSLKFAKEDRPFEIAITYRKATLEQSSSSPSQNGEKLFHEVTITDNGIGFKNEFRERIFEVFSRLHNQSDYPGSGMGLALCRKIMQTHGGAILANGQEGEGAAFKLFFPT